MTGTATTKHPFGELLAQYRARRPGLTQTRLAELAGYDQAILTRMTQGKKDLTGPSGRERILRIIETLADQSAINTLDEANALLLAADLPPLFERQPAEARLIARFGNTPAGLRTRRTNLPAFISSFIGRTSEIAEVRATAQHVAAGHADRLGRLWQDAPGAAPGRRCAAALHRRRVVCRTRRAHRANSDCRCGDARVGAAARPISRRWSA